MTIAMEIETERFVLRSLTARDVTERYLSWLREVDVKRYISAARNTKGLADLKRYVNERADREDVLFLGIFDRMTGVHVGNIKYEPVDSRLRYTIVGILIGDSAYRGKGVTAEVIRASGEWLRDHRNIEQIVLGVEDGNRAAVRAYEKAGFVISATPYIPRTSPEITTMVWYP